MSKKTRFTALFDLRTRARVESLATIRRVPAYQVVADAVEAYFKALSAPERKEVEYLVELWEKRAEEADRIRGK